MSKFKMNFLFKSFEEFKKLYSSVIIADNYMKDMRGEEVKVRILF